MIRPGAMLLTLALMGISALFIGLGSAYLYTLIAAKAEAPKPPIVFLVNIPVLIIATYFLQDAHRAFEHRLYEKFRIRLLWCMMLTIAFLTLQIFGWGSFFRSHTLSSSQLSGYLFILSLTHLLHVTGGLPFLISLFVRTRSLDRILFREETFWHGYLRGLKRYWRFMDVLWILLVVMLWAGYLVRQIT